MDWQKKRATRVDLIPSFPKGLWFWLLIFLFCFSLESSQELSCYWFNSYFFPNFTWSSLRTTLCVRFKSEVVACGVVYAAARRFQVPLPENPPWWKAFDADKSGIDEVCRVLAHLYSLPKAQYIPVCKDGDSFTFSSNKWNSQSQPVSKVIMIFLSASPQILRFIQSWGLTIYSFSYLCSCLLVSMLYYVIAIAALHY